MIIYISAAILLTAGMLSGVLLRYAPFEAIVSKNQKHLLFALYTVCSIINTAVIIIAMHYLGIDFAFDYLRYGGIIFATAMMIVNSAVIKGKFREHLFVYGIVLNCNYLLMTIPNYVVSLIRMPSTVYYLFAVLVIFVLSLILTYVPLKDLLRFTVSPFLYLETGRYWNTVWFIPITYFGTKFLSLGGEHNTGSISQMLSSLLSGIIIVFLCIKLAADRKRMMDSLEIEKQLADQKIHYAEMQSKVEALRRTRHDMKHHIEAIRRYIATDDKEGLSIYCDDLSIANNLDRASLPYTGNVAVDGVVYKYMQLCNGENTDFSYSGTVKNGDISDMDICVLIGNALDNAYNACLTIPEGRYIRMMCRSEPRLLTIIVQNSFDGKIEQTDDNVIISRKRGDRPGVGITSMEAVCNRLGGTIEKNWNENTFNLMIMLPIKETE